LPCSTTSIRPGLGRNLMTRYMCLRSRPHAETEPGMSNAPKRLIRHLASRVPSFPSVDYKRVRLLLPCCRSSLAFKFGTCLRHCRTRTDLPRELAGVLSHLNTFPSPSTTFLPNQTSSPASSFHLPPYPRPISVASSCKSPRSSCSAINPLRARFCLRLCSRSTLLLALSTPRTSPELPSNASSYERVPVFHLNLSSVRYLREKFSLWPRTKWRPSRPMI
jgi:hypothetical protein